MNTPPAISTVQQQVPQQPAAQPMNFTPTPMAPVDPGVPPEQIKLEPLKSDKFESKKKEETKTDKKLLPTLKKNTLAVMGAAVVVAGGILTALLVPKKIKNITTSKELGNYIDQLTQKGLKGLGLEPSNRGISLFFPVENYAEGSSKGKKLLKNLLPSKNKEEGTYSSFLNKGKDEIDKAKDNRADDVAKAIELLQAYNARFYKEGFTSEVNIYLDKIERNDVDAIRAEIERINEELNDESKPYFTPSKELCREIVRIEQKTKEVEQGFFKKLFSSAENQPVKFNIISSVY